MPYKDPVKQAEAQRSWYLREKERLIPIRGVRRTTIRRRNKAFAQRYKLWSGCQFCGYNKCAEALEFHHLDPSTKDSMPNEIIRDSTHMGDIKAELRKCIVLCANCHREEHARLGGRM
jgi:hypothetical protein